MTGGYLCGQAVIAVLPSGSYAVAGHSHDLTLDQATDLMCRTSVGALHLEAGKAVVGLMGPEAGVRYLIGASAGEARDPSGRPWVYRRVIVVTEEAFESIECNPFAVEHELLRQQRFVGRSELPPVDLLEVSERPEELEARCLLGAGPGLGAALSSILRGRPVLWSNCSDALALMRASYAPLPCRVRARLTFATDAAAWPQLPVQVIASTHTLARPDPVARDREETNIDRVGSPSVSDDVGRHMCARMASAIVGWVERNELAILADWRRTADAFLADLPPQASWPDVVAALDAGRAWTEAVLVPSGWLAGLGLAARIEKGLADGVRPPAAVLAAVVAETQDATLGDLEVALKACPPSEIGSLTQAIAVSLVARDLSEAEWNAFLQSASDVAERAGAEIAKAAAPMLVKTGRDQPFIHAVSTRAPGSWIWAQAFRAAWEVDPTPWNPVVLLRGTLHVDEDHTHTTPDAAFLRRVRDYYRAVGVEPGPVVELLDALAEAEEAPGLAAERLVKLMPHSTDLGDLFARAFIWLLSRQETRAALNTVLERIRQAGLSTAWMREEISRGSDSASAIDRAAVALLALEACELGCITQDANPDALLADVVRLTRSAARCCGAFAFPGPLVAAFSRDEPVGGGAWIVEEFNDHPSFVEVLVVSRADVQLFHRIARLAGSAEGTALSAVARGSLLRAALILAAKTSAGRDSLANWVRCIVRKGIRPVPDDPRMLPKEHATPAQLGSAAAETALAAMEILGASEARQLVHDLARIIGRDARNRWFEQAAQALAREIAALQELCRVNQERGASPLKATVILKGVGRAEGLPWWLRYGIWRLLPRGWLGARKRGFK